jgi:hypothetical protein
MSKIQKNIVFIDNAEEFWIGDMDLYSKSTAYIYVPNTSRDKEPKYTKDLAKSGNRYATALLKTTMPNFLNKGFDQKIANRLKKWSENNTNAEKYALFDWDGTISATEGFSLEVFNSAKRIPKRKTYKSRKTPKTTGKSIRNLAAIKYNTTLKEMIETPEYSNTLNNRNLVQNAKSEKFLDDMFVYLMRPDRVEMLRDLFRTLLKNGVHIHIFTHNPYASTTNSYRQIFIEMMWRLFNEDSENQYSKTYKDRHGTLVKIVESSSQQVTIISREELNNMLHSTMDYTKPNELFMKRNMMRGIGLDTAI